MPLRRDRSSPARRTTEQIHEDEHDPGRGRRSARVLAVRLRGAGDPHDTCLRRPEPAVAIGAVQYGTVRRIDVVETTEQPTGGGTVLGGLVGGVLGNQIGHGAGRAAATVLGAVGGGVIGNNLEQQQAAANSSRVYRVVVAFDHGSTRSFDYRELNGLRVGDRVRLDHGALERS